MQCRACLKTNCENATSLDELKIKSFNLITDLCIHKSDGMPQQLCVTCTRDLILCVEFRAKCITSNDILTSAASSNEDLKTPTRIKQEDHEDVINKQENGETNYIEIVKKEVIEVKKEYVEPLQSEDNFVYEYIMSEQKTDDSTAQTSILKEKRKKNARAVNKEIDTCYKKVSQKYDCGLCEEKIEKDKLSDHVRSHENNNYCGLCSAYCREWETILQHRISHLKQPNLICHICLCSFTTPVILDCHYNVKHSGKNEDGFRCPQCDKSYTTIRTLYSHARKLHTNKTFKCTDCSEVFPTDSALSYHRSRKHEKRKRFFCSQCDFTTELRSSLWRHYLWIHKSEKVVCKQCKKLFANENTLKRHKCPYNADAVCPVCGIVVPLRLKEHLATHSDDRRYKCDRCDAAYKTPRALHVHISKHDGVRAHKCDHCPAAFWAYTTLVKHRRVHTGEKPYVCKVCNKGFVANHNLKVHMRVHGVFNLVKKKTPPRVDEPEKKKEVKKKKSKKTKEKPVKSPQECNKSSPIYFPNTQ